MFVTNSIYFILAFLFFAFGYWHSKNKMKKRQDEKKVIKDELNQEN